MSTVQEIEEEEPKNIIVKFSKRLERDEFLSAVKAKRIELGGQSGLEILSDKLDQLDKVILDSLDSIFLPNVQVALRCFLRAAKNIPCVYFVFFTCSYDLHTTLENEELIRKEEDEANNRALLRKRLLEASDFTQLNEEEKEILLELHIEKHKMIFAKKAELRSRIQDDLVEHNRQRKASDLRTFWSYLDKCGGHLGAIHFSKSIKTSGSHTHSSGYQSKDIKDPKESRDTVSSKEKSSTKGTKHKKETAKPVDDTAFYFFKFDIMLSEMLHLLAHWDRKTLEMIKPFPNFAFLMATNRKDSKYTSKPFVKKLSKVRSKSAVSSLNVGVENINENEKLISTAFDPNLGYPVWLINQEHHKRSINIISPIISLLEKMIKINCLTTTTKVCNDTEVMYTVLKKPPSRKIKEKLDVFELIKSETKTEDDKVEITDDEQLGVTSSMVLFTKKKSKKKKLALTPTSSETEQVTVIPMRFIMEPGQIQAITILYKPLHAGSFKYSYHFEAVGTNYKAKVRVVASCDYPRIDTSPSTMFPHHVQTVDSKSMFLNGVFILSQKTLDFGNILFIPEKYV
ncbi:hypothetical protein HHI36_005600 [Cryptolaemus montrouzieri]|uniref:Uncharacterized protein n=1 Tax=Cryptolaemus montrouzieri TaxID=559131 RepID=A0ABD2NUS7_9CUCU